MATAITAITDSRKDDAGTVIEVTITDAAGVVLDISDATTRELIFRRPYTTARAPKAATFTTEGTDGKIQYTTVVTDLDVPGTWEVQAHIITPSGNWRSTVKTFTVGDLL